MLPLALPPPTSIKMETAETLVHMQQGTPSADTSANMPHPPEFESPNVSSTADAMDKLTDRYDFNLASRPLIRDAMDQIIRLDALIITNVRSLAVETDQQHSNLEGSVELCVETLDVTSPKAKESTKNDGLCVETDKLVLKECSVKLISLESILFPPRSSGRNNKDKPQPKDDNSAPKPTSTPLPKQTDMSLDTDQPNTVSSTNFEGNGSPPPGVDKSEKPLKSSKREKKYGCRMCEVRVDTAQELKSHHTSNYGIMYCKSCTKAFNNQLSLV